MKIAIAADHAGYDEKERLKPVLAELGIQYEDLGTQSTESVEYPDFAQKVADEVVTGHVDQGLLVCGSGTGMAIAADKVASVRAAVAWNEEIARLAREHNDAMCYRWRRVIRPRKRMTRSFAPGSPRNLTVGGTPDESRRFARSSRKR